MSGVMLLVSFLVFAGYPLLQVIALVVLRRGWRWAAALPLLLTLPSYGLVIASMTGGVRDGDLSALYLIWTVPPASLYLLLVLGFGLLARARPEPGAAAELAA